MKFGRKEFFLKIFLPPPLPRVQVWLTSLFICVIETFWEQDSTILFRELCGMLNDLFVLDFTRGLCAVCQP